MRRAWTAWTELWDRREPPTVLALVRILVALALLGDLTQALLNDAVVAVWGPPPHGLGYGMLAARRPILIDWLGATPGTAWTMWTAAVVLSALLLVGALTRVSAIALALLLAQMARAAPDTDRGIDYLLRIVLVVLGLSLSHARWSVDAWVRRRLGRPYPAEVPAWPRLLLFAQLVWMYFSAGISKADVAWFPQGGFAALANILSDPHFARFEPGWTGALYPLTQVATAATMMFELGAPVFLAATWLLATRERGGRVRALITRLRLPWLWLAIGVGFHVGIAVTMQLGMFPWGTLAVYPVFFAPAELARAFAFIARRVGAPRYRSPRG